MLSKAKNTTVLFSIVLMGIILQFKHFNEFPIGTHSWARCDRYAIAQGFVNNDLNFFKPETFLINKQFPDNWETEHKSSVTAVDFPINDFLVAIIMKVFKTKAPWTFQIYGLLFSFLGLFYLYKLSFLFTQKTLASFLTTSLAALSPVFVFYQTSLLPSIPSLSLTIIGLYFYFSNIKTPHYKAYIKAIIFFTLAILSRSTFAIILIALSGIEFLALLKNRKDGIRTFIPILLSGSIILIYLIYNNSLRDQNGSLFLNYLLPAENFKDFIDTILVAIERWKFDYFSKYQLLFIGTLCSFNCFVLFSNTISVLTKRLLFLGVISLFGCFCFSYLMVQQYPHHDYYFLDTFFLPLILLSISGISIVKSFNKRIITFPISLFGLIVLIPAFIKANENFDNRIKEGLKGELNQTLNSYENSEALLNALEISAQSKILTFEEGAPNLPFLKLNRKGFNVLNTNRETIQKALKWNFDYIITQNQSFLKNIYQYYPDFIHFVKIIGGNGKITIGKLTNEPQQNTLQDFLGFNDKTVALHQKLDYHVPISPSWKNINKDSITIGSKKYVQKTTPEMNYSLFYKNKNLKFFDKEAHTLFVRFKLKKDSNNSSEIKLVTAINNNSNNTYYKYQIVPFKERNSSSWQEVNHTFKIPREESGDIEFSLGILNPSHEEFWIGDFEFWIYKN